MLTLTLSLFVPGQLHSRLNGSGSRAHWTRISRESELWKVRTQLRWLICDKPTWRGPARVTFTAYVGRLWDDDNLPAALKSVRDKIAELILESDDGPTSGHEFVYAQEVKPPAARGVLITVEAK